MNRFKRHICRQCRLLPALAVWLAWPFIGAAQGIIFYQLPPSPSLGLVQNTNGDWVDPFAPYDAQGLRLWGTSDNPTSYNLVIDGQVAFIFSSGAAFTVTAVGSNAVSGQIVTDYFGFGTTFATPLTSGQPIGANVAGYDWVTGGGLITATIGSDTIGQPNLTIGAFSGLASAYLGLEFYEDDQACYGWVRVGAPATINGGWIYDYAYETTPNTPIFAGAVPEPSTSWLILAGIGIFAFRHWFLSRKAKSTFFASARFDGRADAWFKLRAPGGFRG